MERGAKQTSIEYPQKIYSSQLITLDDLQQFKAQLLQELLSMLKDLQPNTKKWMKSHEVRRMLKISPGTLQTLKNNGTIPFTKVGGVHFYDFEKIKSILESTFK